jgi:hypothetical protein
VKVLKDGFMCFYFANVGCGCKKPKNHHGDDDFRDGIENGCMGFGMRDSLQLEMMRMM